MRLQFRADAVAIYWKKSNNVINVVFRRLDEEIQSHGGLTELAYEGRDLKEATRHQTGTLRLAVQAVDCQCGSVIAQRCRESAGLPAIPPSLRPTIRGA
jgi:hypothetical protein